jgi:chromosome segregation ATPase
MLQESHEQTKMLRAQLRDNEIKFDHVSVAKTNLEAKLSNLKVAKDKNLQDLTMSQQENEEMSTRLKNEIELRTSLEKKLRLAEESKEILADKLDLNEEQIASLRLSLEAQQQLIAERERKLDNLEDELEDTDRLALRYKEMESLLEEYMAENKDLETREAELVERCRLQGDVIDELRKELDPLQEETQSYKEKYESLLAMIEPFKEQLESFEMEKAALLNQNQEAKGEVKKLATQVRTYILSISLSIDKI